MRGDGPKTQDQELEVPRMFIHREAQRSSVFSKQCQNGKNSNYNASIPRVERELFSKHRKEEKIKVVPGEPEWQRFEMVEKQNWLRLLSTEQF